MPGVFSRGGGPAGEGEREVVMLFLFCFRDVGGLEERREVGDAIYGWSRGGVGGLVGEVGTELDS